MKGTRGGGRGDAGSRVYPSSLLRISFLCSLHTCNSWQSTFRSGNLCSFNRKTSHYVIGNPVYRETSVPGVLDASVKAYSNRKKDPKFCL